MNKYVVRWTILVIGLIGTMALFFMFKNKNARQVCQDFEVKYADSQVPMISKAEIQMFLENDTIRFIGDRISAIDLSKIETSLNKIEYIQNADCYFNMSGVLFMDIEQKTALLRVIPTHGKSYYLDQQGHHFPLSTRHTADVLVATGYITPVLDNKLYTFTRYVNQSTFWNSFIEQIFVKPNGDIIFTTQIGGHEVVVGDNCRLKQKLQKLKQFYQRASANQGWEEYREINLKYKDQVICKK
ncbi:MAG: cell division protein FtsQ [Bacteroidia bacterium]|jgi:cell division protein FtsQ